MPAGVAVPHPTSSGGESVKLTFNEKSHSYWLEGQRCKGVTSIAALPDDRYALEQWRARMVATGIATEPSLAERIAAHFTDKAKLNDLCEEALQIARSHVAAEVGTAVHRLTERVDLDEPILDTPLSR